MSNTSVNSEITPAKKLGVSLFNETVPVRYSPASSADEIDAVINAIYKQVLDNAHVMESERQQIPEAQFRQGQLSVVEFIRSIALSDLYRTRFFDNGSSTRFIELSLKHFLGREPENANEIVYYGAILENDGYEAVVDACLNSDEYVQAFGADSVPYARDYKTGVDMKTLAQAPAGVTQSLLAAKSKPLMVSSAVASAAQAQTLVAATTWLPAFSSRPVVPEITVQVRSPYAPTQPIQPEAAQLCANFAAATAFINPVVNPDQPLGVNSFVNTAPVRRFPTSSADEIEIIIRAVYKHILSNAHVMESERLPVAESQFRRGELNVIEFIRQVAYSDMYRTRFFDNGSRNRFIELNFKHFLGRAPESLAEIAHHSAILGTEGYEAEIDSYLDSDEYHQAFGSETVPFYRGYKTEAVTMAGFTHMFSLLRGASSSDKNVTENNPERLTLTLFAEQPSEIVSPSGAIARKIDQSPAEILQSLFKPNPVLENAVPTPSAVPSVESDLASELELQVRSQSELIAQLETQLAEMRPFSNMGAAILSKGQRPASAAPETPLGSGQLPVSAQSYQGNVATLEPTLEQTATEQAQKIETLQGELLSAKSLANIADYKLNKWRNRSY